MNERGGLRREGRKPKGKYARCEAAAAAAEFEFRAIAPTPISVTSTRESFESDRVRERPQLRLEVLRFRTLIRIRSRIFSFLVIPDSDPVKSRILLPIEIH